MNLIKRRNKVVEPEPKLREIETDDSEIVDQEAEEVEVPVPTKEKKSRIEVVKELPVQYIRKAMDGDVEVNYITVEEALSQVMNS